MPLAFVGGIEGTAWVAELTEVQEVCDVLTPSCVLLANGTVGQVGSKFTKIALRRCLVHGLVGVLPLFV